MPPETDRPVILIVEDDDAVREVVAHSLAMEGYMPCVAANGLEGLAQLEVTRPDLVILDVNMPVMDGWETLDRLRKVSRCPVIMLTMFWTSEDVVRGLELGADDYMAKPFGAQELVARVNAVLRRANLG